MKYKNYLNTKNGSNRIYSTDNLLQMTMNDILDVEDALGYQYNTIGLPDDSDLFNSSFVRQTRTPKGTLEWQSILDDGIAPQTNIVNHIVDPQTSGLKTPPFVPQYKQVMNTTPQNFFSTQKSTYELLEEERERQRQQQLQQQQLSQNLGNTPVQTQTSSMPMEEIAPVDLGGTSINMNLVGDLVNTAVNKYKTRKKKPESKSVLKDAIDTEVNNKPLKQTDLQEAIKTSTTPNVEDPKTTSPIGNAIDETTTLRNDPLWDELTKSLPNATPEGEWDLVEQQRLKNFDKVWNEKNGVLPNIASEHIPVEGTEPKLLKGGVIYAKPTLKKKVQDYLHKHVKPYRDYEGLTPMEKLQKWTGKWATHFTGREYYGLASELSDDGKPAPKRKRDNDFYKLDDFHNTENKRIIEENMVINMGLDPNDPASYEKIKDIDIVIPKANSSLNKQIKASEQIADYIVNNYDYLKHNLGINKVDKIQFQAPGMENLGRDYTDRLALHTVFNNAQISSKMNNDGSITIMVPDYYDFKHLEQSNDTNLLRRYRDNLIINANNRAYEQQEAGKLKNYSLVPIITLSKDEVETIMRRHRENANK